MLTVDVLKNKGVDQGQYEGFVTSLMLIALYALSLVDIKDSLEQLGYITQLEETKNSMMVFLSTADGQHTIPLASVTLVELARIPA